MAFRKVMHTVSHRDCQAQTSWCAPRLVRKERGTERHAYVKDLVQDDNAATVRFLNCNAGQRRGSGGVSDKGKIRLVSWEKGYQAVSVSEQPNTALYSTVMTSERKNRFQWLEFHRSFGRQFLRTGIQDPG